MNDANEDTLFIIPKENVIIIHTITEHRRGNSKNMPSRKNMLSDTQNGWWTETMIGTKLFK